MRFLHMNEEPRFLDLGLHRWPGTKPHNPNTTEKMRGRFRDAPARFEVRPSPYRRDDSPPSPIRFTFDDDGLAAKERGNVEFHLE